MTTTKTTGLVKTEDIDTSVHNVRGDSRNNPPSIQQIEFLHTLMRERGLDPELHTDPATSFATSQKINDLLATPADGPILDWQVEQIETMAAQLGEVVEDDGTLTAKRAGQIIAGMRLRLANGNRRTYGGSLEQYLAEEAALKGEQAEAEAAVA